MVNREQLLETDEALLLQQHRRSAHEGDPSPVPDHDDEDAGCEECLHGKPHFSEASVLMDALGGEINAISVNSFICKTRPVGLGFKKDPRVF